MTKFYRVRPNVLIKDVNAATILLNDHYTFKNVQITFKLENRFG